MSNDETVDGPKIAAKILSEMDPTRKQRLIEAIHRADPAAAKLIRENLLDFKDLVTISDQGIQRLITAVEHRDLVLSLKLAPDEVREKLLRNMTERKREVVKEDLASLPPTLRREVDAAQRRIAKKLDELRTLGVARSKVDGDEWV